MSVTLMPGQPAFDAFAAKLEAAGLIAHGFEPPLEKPQEAGARPIFVQDWNPHPDPTDHNLLNHQQLRVRWRPWATEPGAPHPLTGKPVAVPKAEYREAYERLLGEFLVALQS